MDYCAICIRSAIFLLLTLPSLTAAPFKEWELREFGLLCEKYLQGRFPEQPSEAEMGEWLDRLFSTVGSRLAASGRLGVPPEDLALLALLQGRLASSREEAPAAPDPPARDAPAEVQPEGSIINITKGREGFQQAMENLASLPASEKMVITGDVTAGLLAATVPSGPDMTSPFGRTRLNFAMRALPGSNPETGEGAYFFVQVVAAGGAPDSSRLGGPRPFSALNDAATDRSAFNESLSRGNLYLGKAFYQQRLGGQDTYLIGRAGVVDMSDYFDTNLFANNEARQFINSTFVNSPGYKAGVVAPGAVLEFHRPLVYGRLRSLAVRGGYALSRADRAFTSPLWTGEVEVETLFRDRTGHIRLGGALGNVAGTGSIQLLYINMDHWLTPEVGAFARFAAANRGAGSLSFGPARYSYSGGIEWNITRRNDQRSAWGLGFGQTFPVQDLASERVVETYYRWQPSQNFAITPDFQFILGSGGRRSKGTQAGLGLRLHFGF